MWAACMWKSNIAVLKAEHLAKCIASWFLEASWLILLTTAELSHWIKIFLPCQEGPHGLLRCVPSPSLLCGILKWDLPTLV